MIFFIANLMVALILYFMLLSQTLYPVILGLIESVSGAHREISLDFDLSQFSYTYTCLVVFLGLLLISLKKDLRVFIKLNSLGSFFIMIIVVFIIGVGVLGFMNT